MYFLQPVPIDLSKETEDEDQHFYDASPYQLGPQKGHNIGRKTLVLDLDETLVHSSFKPVKDADIVLKLNIDNIIKPIYVLKRPGVEQFLQTVSKYFEIVVYTASLAVYADPLIDELDVNRVVSYRLFRECCTPIRGNLVKDLSLLGRRLKHTAIVDNSPLAYGLQPQNSIPITTWFDDPEDRELLDLLPILEKLSHVDDLPSVLQRSIHRESPKNYHRLLKEKKDISL
jgi:RNA polymerase II subunit A small phosphatase-like protein